MTSSLFQVSRLSSCCRTIFNMFSENVNGNERNKYFQTVHAIIDSFEFGNIVKIKALPMAIGWTFIPKNCSDEIDKQSEGRT